MKRLKREANSLSCHGFEMASFSGNNLESKCRVTCPGSWLSPRKLGGKGFVTDRCRTIYLSKEMPCSEQGESGGVGGSESESSETGVSARLLARLLLSNGFGPPLRSVDWLS